MFAFPVISNEEADTYPLADTCAPTNADDVPADANTTSPAVLPTTNVLKSVLKYGSPNANEPDCCAVLPRLNFNAILFLFVLYLSCETLM